MVEAEGRTIFKDPDSIAHSANLLVCIGGLASATGLIAGAGVAGASALTTGYLSYREISKRLPAGTKRLAEELGSELQKKLAEPGLNDDTRRLIPQMIEASLPSPQRVMEAGHDSAALVEMMVARLTDKEQRNPDHIGPFKRIVGHLLEKLLADPQFANELAPAFRKQVLADTQTIKASIEGLERQFGSLSEALTHVGTLGKANRDQLEALASRFEIDRVFEIGDTELRSLLEAKAEEYRAYKAQIDMIDERTIGLGNLKVAAQEAADRLDLEEVENLLAIVHVTELGIAAKTAELRADNALLRGRVEEAYRLLSATADSLAAVDPVVPAMFSSNNAKRLYDHGLRYGGPGLELAENMLYAALRVCTRNDQAELWATIQSNLGLVLYDQGVRTGGAEGTSLIARAIDAYRAALEIRNEKEHPVAWAETQNNLGNAFLNQGAGIGGPTGANLIGAAVDAYRASLRVRTEESYPKDWADTQVNLGNALLEQGKSLSGAEGLALIAEAVDTYRAALSVHTENEYPVEWAKDQKNLSNALPILGIRVGGVAGAAHIAGAVKASRLALKVFKEGDHPMDWAATQNNLAIALRLLGTIIGREAGADLIAQAVEACRLSLRVHTEKDHPIDWATTQSNLAIMLTHKGAWTYGPDGVILITEAIDTYHAALRIYTESDYPLKWAGIQNNMALTEEELAKHDSCVDSRPHLQAALGHLDAALRVFDPDHMPYDYGIATKSRARIQAKLDALDGS